jgi:hypothetical protein
MPENPQTPPADNQTSVAWKRVSTALAVLALAAVIGPVLANRLMSSSEHAPCKSEQRKEKPAAESEEEEEEEESARPAPMLNSGGGSRSGGSSGTSSSDVIACNRAAAAARRRTEAPQHQGLAKALDAAGGGLLGATAQSLHGVEQQAGDDVRAAEAFKACMATQ